MATAPHDLLAAVQILRRDAHGRLTLVSAADTAPCDSVPPFEEALTAAASSGQPIRVALRREGEKDLPAALVPVPGSPREALVLPLTAANDALGPVIENLVNQIAHDVRNHAFAVGLQAELGQRRAADSPAAGAAFEAILRQLDTLRLYLDRLLLFGRPLALTRVSMKVEDFLREQVQRCRDLRKADAPPLVISLVADGVGSARWDPQALGHALQALLDNAARSAVPPPPIWVEAHGDERSVIIEVRDEGPGIPEATLASLDTPMRVRRAGGAGLGLAIARKMVEAHGGALELASNGPGTRVRMKLPREAPPG
jgi:signal transduction histidine kinase